MIELFKNKIKNEEYIPNSLYQTIKNNISNNFDIEKYNKYVINKLYIKYQKYFEEMFKEIDSNIHLDYDQISAILSDEDYTLVIAGAGTGKTTTIAAKVKYLVDIKKVPPSKILVMSYTKKATMELQKRVQEDFNIPAHITTFHSLGYEYIKTLFKNRKCLVIDHNDKEQIFYDYFIEIFKDKEKIIELMDLFTFEKKWIFSKWFKNNFDKFSSYEELFEEYKKYKINEAQKSPLGLENVINELIERKMNYENITTVNGEYVKSVAEAKIANYLFKNNIIYNYEKCYSELMDNNSPYKPDFTIDFAGIPVYIEYFGLDNKKYNEIKNKKRELHIKNNNIFIELENTPIEDIEKELEEKLTKIGINLNKRTNEEIYEKILDNNKLSIIYPLKDLFYETIDSIKESINRGNYLNIITTYINSLPISEKEQAIKQLNYINDFYHYYQKRLYNIEEYKFDYSDLLYYANKYIENIEISNHLNFDYIIIDEYQDISQHKYELARKTASRNNAKVYAVGDDWQSIFSFSGSKIEYIYNFKSFFKDAKVFKISKTYRNSQELLNVSGEFIMKNPMQIKKQLLSDKHIHEPIKLVYFTDKQEYLKLKDLILEIHKSNPNHSILVLGRTNAIIDKCFEYDYFKDDLGTKITFLGYDDIILEGMTMHKSKGLTFDEVIVIGLDKKFPCSEKENFWIIDLFKYKKIEEAIPFAEERRLFYVALTRTKNKVYLLINESTNKQSIFLEEIKQLIDNNSF